MVSKKASNRNEQLAKRTVQIIGFGFSVALTLFKLVVNPEADIPWWVIFGFFGFGASADGAVLNAVLGFRNGKR